MPCKRGRPVVLDHEPIKDVILKYSQDVINVNGNVASVKDEVWSLISDELDNHPKVSSLHSFVCGDRYDIRKELMKKNGISVESDIDTTINSSLEISRNDNSLNDSSFLDEDKEKKFMISIPQNEWKSLIVLQQYKQKIRNKAKCRERRCLIPGKWTSYITNLVWTHSKMKCGFNFINHYVPGGISGYINGQCSCSNSLHIDIDERNDENVILHCIITVRESSKQCSKTYLRQPLRETFAKETALKSAEAFRAEKAKEMMLPGDPEPPHLPKLSVLHAAKTQYVASKHVDPDPIKAIALLKGGKLKNIIHRTGNDPFYVHYYTTHQRNLYNLYVKNGEVTQVSIDGSGVRLLRINKMNGELSGPVHMYLMVIRSLAGQFSISQMITETHTTEDISFWLSSYEHFGAIRPKEVVCDGSDALLNACARTYTNNDSIRQYADKCRTSTPRCWIRCDVAHFIKNWATTLTKHVKNKKVKIFYLATIGRLIRCKNLEEAEALIRAILAVSLSETSGYLPSKEPTLCQKETEFLHKLITNELENESQILMAKIEETREKNAENDVDTIESSVEQNSWSTWFNEMKKEVLNTVENENDEGSSINGYYCIQVTQYLLLKMSLFPVWSTVCQTQFGYNGECEPASSASVEGEFNKVKNCVFKNRLTGKIRPDEAIEKHCDYLLGRNNTDIAKAAEIPMNNHYDMSENEINAESSTSQTNNQASEKIDEIHSSSPFEFENTSEHETSESVNELVDKHQTVCPACANGDAPGGAHKCSVCNRAVHALVQCSVATDDLTEGYGQSRICLDCHTNTIPKSARVEAGEMFEDWGGEVSNDKKKKRKRGGIYLGKNPKYIKDKLAFEDHRSLPILKNGSDPSIQAVHYKEKKITLYNTCHYDAIFQLLLAGYTDYPEIKKKMQLFENSDLIYESVLHAAKHGITPASYIFRAELLCQLFIEKNGLVDCQSDVGTVATFLLHNIPSLKEIYQCNEGCQFSNESVIMSLEKNMLINFSDNIKSNFIDQSSKIHHSCQAPSLIKERVVGEIFAVEIFTDGLEIADVALKELPQFFENPITSMRMPLIGVISYRGPVIRRSHSDHEIGHYSAIALRQKLWYEYDGLSAKEKKITNKKKISPALLLFGKV